MPLRVKGNCVVETEPFPLITGIFHHLLPSTVWLGNRLSISTFHMQSSFPIKEFDEVGRSILTFTSIVQRVGREHCPTTTNRSQIPAFLRHLATLINCSDESDTNAKNDIAVTGSLFVWHVWRWKMAKHGDSSKCAVVRCHPTGTGRECEERMQRMSDICLGLLWVACHRCRYTTEN